RDDLHASTSGTITITLRVKRKAGVSAQYRATAYAVGGKSSSTTTSSLQGATTADIATDTAAPSGLNTPILDWTASSKLRVRNLTFSGTSIANNYQTLKEKYVVLRMSDGSVTTYFDFTQNYFTNTESVARYKIGLVSEFKFGSAKKRYLEIAFA